MPEVAMVVDDSMLIRHTVCRFLEERGFVVESACNGEEAMQLLAAAVQPSIIITDMQMPKMTGSEFITALKSKPSTAAIPIIVLAGRQSGLAQEKESRAQYTIYKDIDIEDQLQVALTATLGMARGTSA
jgi:CheY-like chemotaxis protein